MFDIHMTVMTKHIHIKKSIWAQMIDAEVLNAEQFSFASKPVCLELHI